MSPRGRVCLHGSEQSNAAFTEEGVLSPWGVGRDGWMMGVPGAAGLPGGGSGLPGGGSGLPGGLHVPRGTSMREQERGVGVTFRVVVTPLPTRHAIRLARRAGNPPGGLSRRSCFPGETAADSRGVPGGRSGEGDMFHVEHSCAVAPQAPDPPLWQASCAEAELVGGAAPAPLLEGGSRPPCASGAPPRRPLLAPPAPNPAPGNPRWRHSSGPHTPISKTPLTGSPSASPASPKLRLPS